MKDFRRLTVWQKAHQLAVAVYGATASFPRAELYGLTSQVRRASVSIPANIAEGCGRKGEPEFGRFLQMALGSASELEYHLLLARELKLLSQDEYQVLDNNTSDVKRMLSGLIRKLSAHS